MKAGSITFSTALDNEQLEKDLSSLTKKIEKKEREIADLAVQRDEAKGKGAFDAAVLDAEKAKLQEIKDRLADIRARAKDKTLSLEKRDAAKELIPSVKQEYDDQRVRVRGLQTEWNKTEAAVERYGAQLSKAEDELSRQKSEAGYIVRKLDEAKKSASRMAAEAGIADQRIINLNRELSELNARQKELESAGIGYGYEEYDQNAARIAEINRELKEYKKSLTEVAAAEQAAGQARQQAGQTAGSQSRINTYLEKTSSLYQKLNGMIGKTTKMSGVLREAATSSTGQIGSAITSILGILETVPGIVGAIAGKIGAIIATALPEIRVIAYIIVIVIELIKKLGDLISQKMQAIKDDGGGLYRLWEAGCKRYFCRGKGNSKICLLHNKGRQRTERFFEAVRQSEPKIKAVGQRHQASPGFFRDLPGTVYGPAADRLVSRRKCAVYYRPPATTGGAPDGLPAHI